MIDIFVALAGSWTDHYGMAAMYLRLNGLVPPTAKQEEKNIGETKCYGPYWNRRGQSLKY
jgi:hypothetical protein